MSAPAGTTGRSEAWLEAYLELGTDRSLRKLIAESEQIARSKGLGKPPSAATIFRWSSHFGWDRRAGEHDAAVAARAWEQLLQRRANVEEERIDLSLSHAEVFHHVVQSALVLETPQLDDNGEPIMTVVDGRPTPLLDRRVATYADHSPQAWRAIMAIHDQAVQTERTLLAGSSERYRQMQEAGGAQGPVINVLGREATMEIGFKVGRLVKALAKETARRRADLQLAATRQEQTPEEEWNADDPGLQWVEVDDDE
jgi:hypothetical protein